MLIFGDGDETYMSRWTIGKIVSDGRCCVALVTLVDIVEAGTERYFQFELSAKDTNVWLVVE
jgi:hypothetical protein